MKNDYNIISTGGTYKHILQCLDGEIYDLNKRVISVESFTGFPEILNGRVKTLHPKIYGGILYDPNNIDHVKDYEKFNDTMYKLEKIDLVVVNLYPFQETVEKNEKEEEVIEQIDIGGVTLIRSCC